MRKNKILITISILVLILLLTITPALALEASVGGKLNISPWAIPNVHDGQMMGIVAISGENLSRDFTEVVSYQDNMILNENIVKKLDALNIEPNENFSPIEVPDNSTRRAVILYLYNILGKYDKSITLDTDPIQYLIDNKILLGKGDDYGLDEVATVEEAITFYTRGITNVYNDNNLGGKGVFYKVENAGNTAYLLGSIHVGDFSMYPLEKDRIEAFDKSDVLYIELNLMDQETIEEATKYQFRSDGTTLKEDLGDELYSKVKEEMEKLNVPEEMILNMETWALLNTLSTLPMQLENPYTSALGVDNFFLTHAILRGMKIVSLETVELQMSILKEYYSREEGKLNEAIEEALNNLKSEEGRKRVVDELKYMQKIWTEGNEKELAETFSSDESSPILVNTRDPMMAESIKKLLESPDGKTYFIVVGAGHYAPENSVIKYLKDFGFEIEDLNN